MSTKQKKERHGTDSQTINKVHSIFYIKEMSKTDFSVYASIFDAWVKQNHTHGKLIKNDIEMMLNKASSTSNQEQCNR